MARASTRAVSGALFGVGASAAGAIVGLLVTRKDVGIVLGASIGNLVGAAWKAQEGDAVGAATAFAVPGFLVGAAVVAVRRASASPPPVGLAQSVCAS